ncbi:MAG: hypothetical protein LBQ50_00300 [Planctomycetaceae bacterium]|nr:hypothetical protein [Planctomycetaceae bacterium]
MTRAASALKRFMEAFVTLNFNVYSNARVFPINPVASRNNGFNFVSNTKPVHSLRKFAALLM